MDDVVLHQKIHEVCHVVRCETNQKGDQVCHHDPLCSSAVCLGVVWVSVPPQAPDSLDSAETHGCHAAEEDELQGAKQACVLPRALGEVMEAGRDVVALSMQSESRGCPHRGAQADESTDHGRFLDGPEGEGHKRVLDSDVPIHTDAQGDEDAAVHIHKVKALQSGAKHRPQVPVVLKAV